MTVIAALATDAGVWMAADTVASSSDRRWYNTHKISAIPVGNEVAHIAFAGRSSLRNLVSNELAIADAPTPGSTESAYDEWAHAVIRGITTLAVKAKPPLTEEGELAGIGLLMFRGRMWSLETNSADRAEGYECIGSGQEVALGVLYALEETGNLLSDPERSLRMAVAAAARWNHQCGGPSDVEMSPR